MGITLEELQLAARNHAMPLETLRDDITPVGLHYLLIHFDIPQVDAPTWRLEVGELSLTLDELKARPRRTLPVTLECAGNGRAFFENRALSQPWLLEAVGTSEWTGTPLAPLIREAGLEDAVEIVFTGLDRGVQDDDEHNYARSLPVAEAMRDEMLLAYEMNGVALPPQHGFPLRLVVPGWYGMTHVKWLRSITGVDRPFDGWQQASAYKFHTSEDDPGTPVQRILPRSLLVPPGIPDFFTRERRLASGRTTIEGRAWSGFGAIERVEVGFDGRWHDAELAPHLSDHAWRGFRVEWDATPGSHVLSCRATDATGRTQPDEAEWNTGGYCNNAIQRVLVVVA